MGSAIQSEVVLRIVSTVVLMALVNGMFLAGCASVRGPTRLARLQETPVVEPAIQSWESVAFIPVVSPVAVDLTTGETINGRFRSADAGELVLEQDGTLRRVPRAEIQRVVLYQGRHAGRGSLWGLGIGTGIGIAVDADTGHGSDFGERFLFTLIFVGLGTGIGALIGSAFQDREVIPIGKPPA